ncbi:VOC family protein [soil metagenome]
MSKNKITPFLWFDNNLDEAITFYKSVFKNVTVGYSRKYPEGGMGKPGTIMTANFNIDGQEFMGLNGGPYFKFTEAISFFVNCDGQEEVDFYWEKLSEGGSKSRCGWLKDKFGLSWQIVPSQLGELLSNPDPEKAKRVTQAMLKMEKLIIADLENA